MFRTGFIAASAAGLMASTGLSASPAIAETPQGAAEKLQDFLGHFPDLGPGYAVVVVTADDVVLNHVQGTRRASTGAPMTADTPVYIASQTKAYVGLMASVLDERGILDLDSTIADHWPEVEFPGDVDPAAYTMRDLLSHQVPISAGLITFLEAYVTELDPADYPALIAEHGQTRDEGFRYDNLGYNIYGAILHTATGKSWQDWLDEVIFDPMAMDQTSARTSDFSLDTLSWNHIWQGEELGWHEVRPKTDPIMQSAGGLVTSINDMAAWLQMQLRGEGPAGTNISADAVAAAQTSYAQTGMEDGRNPYEMSCSGYSLGWSICDLEGHAVHIHGGGYIGARTMMAFSSGLGVGIAAFSNSDNQTGWFTSRATVNMFLMYLLEDERTERMEEIRIGHYPERIARSLQNSQDAIAERNAREDWGGWTWQPDMAALAEYEGRYQPDIYDGVQFVLAIEDGQLVGRMDGYTTWLRPAQPDLFGGQSSPFDGAARFHFTRDEAGTITGINWDDQHLERIGN